MRKAPAEPTVPTPPDPTSLTPSDDEVTPPISFQDLAQALSHLAALCEDMAEPAVSGLTDKLYIQPGTFLHLSDSLQALVERIEASHGEG